MSRHALPNVVSAAQARRIALRAQGFLDPRHVTPTLRTFQRTLDRTGVLQVDSVNVLQRAHFMPLFSRMGPYDTRLLHRAAEQSPRRVVEYWAHVQAFMPVDLWPVMQHRMASYRSRLTSKPMQAALLREVRARGACTARELDDGSPRTRTHWGWNWSDARRVLHSLYLTGQLAIAGRNSQFEVRYDLPEQVIPPAILAQPTPSPRDAHGELVRRAARSHGIGTVRCLADYFRMKAQQVRPAIDELIEARELQAVTIEGWPKPAYLHAEARTPRKVHARALLSPFDPLIWERERTLRLFGMHYRIEIYVPREKRVHGYYVLPFLLGDAIAARVDLKADRKADCLIVQSAWAEPDAPPDTAAELMAELRQTAAWLVLSTIRIMPRGNLATRLSQLI